jgi:hypothetical protein
VWVLVGAPLSRTRRLTDKPGYATTAVGVSHCGAGYTLGVIAAEFAVFAVFALGASIAGLPLLAEYVGDYLLAVARGVIFQYFAIAPCVACPCAKVSWGPPKPTCCPCPRSRSVCWAGWPDVLRSSPTPTCPVIAPSTGFHADRHDRRLCHRLADPYLADPPRHQSSHVAPTSQAGPLPGNQRIRLGYHRLVRGGTDLVMVVEMLGHASSTRRPRTWIGSVPPKDA